MYIEIFNMRLTEARKKAGYTQNEAAAELNIPRSTLANYETGRTQPDIETLCKLIDLYKVNASWILGTGMNE